MPAAGSGGVCELVSFLSLITNMSSQQEMRSITFDASGTLSVAIVPAPVLLDGEVMIEVKNK